MHAGFPALIFKHSSVILCRIHMTLLSLKPATTRLKDQKQFFIVFEDILVLLILMFLRLPNTLLPKATV